MSVRITLPDLPVEDSTELFQSIVEALTILRVGQVTLKIPESEINVVTNGNSNRQTKGKRIWQMIQESVASGEYVDRTTIAEECQSTVSRVAEVLKEQVSHPDALRYRQMAKLKRIPRIHKPKTIQPVEVLVFDPEA